MGSMRILALHPRDWAGWAGKDLHGVDVRHVSIGGYVPRRLTGEATWDGIGDVVDQNSISLLYSTTKDFEPDAFLFGIHLGFERWHLERFREISPKTFVAMHYTDQRDGVPKEVAKYEGLLDVLLLNNDDSDDHDKYRKVGFRTATFYDGFSPFDYWPRPAGTTCDVFFGGNNHAGLQREIVEMGKEPIESLNFPRSEFRENLLVQIGRYFDLIVRGRFGWRGTPLRVKPMLFHPRFNDAMREAKIVLGTSVYPKHKLYMRRLFRSVASGRMTIMEKTPGMEEDFENGRHFSWFETVDDCLDLIRYYLDHDEEREKVARQGRRHFVENHTFKNRLVEFVEIVRSRS